MLKWVISKWQEIGVWFWQKDSVIVSESYSFYRFSLIQPNVHEGLFALASGLMMRTFYVESSWVIALYYWYIMKDNHMSFLLGIDTMLYEYITDGRHVLEQISISCLFCPNTLEVSCILSLDPQVITYGKDFYSKI